MCCVEDESRCCAKVSEAGDHPSSPTYYLPGLDYTLPMRALVLRQPSPFPRLTVTELPSPQMRDSDALVRVKACGFCHHDLLVMNGTLRRGVRPPLIPGHEVAGVVTEIGPNVATLRPGDHVVGLLTDACGRCDLCSQGLERLCPHGQAIGHGMKGGMAQLLAARETTFVKIPKEIPFPQACLLACPISVALKAVDKVQIRPNETILVTGASGGLGAHLIQLANLRGARVFAVTSDESKTPALEALGASYVIPTGELDFSEIILALAQDRGVDVALDTVGSPLFPQTLRSVALKGRLILLGEVEREKANLPLPEIIFREQQIIGSVGTTRRHVEQAAQLVAEGKIHPVISHTLPWTYAETALQLMQQRRNVGRIVLDFAQANGEN